MIGFAYGFGTSIRSGSGGYAPILRVASMGDSIPGYEGNATIWRPHYMTYARALNRQKFEPVLDASSLPYFSTGGYTTVQVQTTLLPLVLASNANACVVHCGTNDYPTGRTAAQVTATLREIAASLASAGIMPIMTEVLPLPTGQAAKSAWIVGVNAALNAEFATRGDVVWVDWAGEMDSNGDGVADSDGYFSDSVHPDADGWGLIGPYLATKMSSVLTDLDIYDGITWVSPNPLMSGTTPEATGWDIDAGSGRTATGTIISRGGALGNWQQIAISGSAGASTLRYGFGTGSGGFAPGDVIEFVVEVETDNDLSANWYVNARGYDGVGGVSERLNEWRYASDTITSVPRMASYVLRTPRRTLPVSTDTIWPTVVIGGTGTFRIGRCGYRKLN